MWKVPDKKLGETASGSNNFVFGGGFAEGIFKDASKTLFGAASSNVPTFTFGAPTNEVTNENKNKQLILSKKRNGSSPIERSFYYNKQLLSLVYKCTACGLCFDRQEVISQHINNCLPLKKITRIHCICGLEFDIYNYEYHCKVHREINVLKKKNVTIHNDETIDVGAMANKFMHDTKQGTVSVENKYKIKATATDDKPMSKGIRILPKKKNRAGVVYRCKCRLCFERLELMFDHLNKCDPNEKITRVLCMCGLEFDMHNYDHHCEVHRKFDTLHVKKVTINDDDLILINGMKNEFAENDQKAAKTTKDAQVQTVHLNESFIKSVTTERSFKGNGTFEQLLGHKIISAVIDTIESGVDGKENQTKITIIVEKESDKTAEGPNKTNTDYRNNEVAEKQKSKTTASQQAVDDSTNEVTEGDHEGTASQEVSDAVPNENTAPAIPENKAINSSDPADGKTNEISEQNEQHNIDQQNSDTTNESFAVTTYNPANKAIDSPEPTDIVSYKITTPIDEYNKFTNKNNIFEFEFELNNHENSDILTNETSAVTPTIPANKPIDGPESTEIGSHGNTTVVDGYNKINNNQENSDILTNETSAVTPIIPANKPIDGPESTEIGSHGNTTVVDGYNNINNNQENSDILTNETSAVTPTIPANKPIDGPESTEIGSHGNTAVIDGYNKINNNQENSDISTNENTVSIESENKANDGPEQLEDSKVIDIPTKQNNGDNSKLQSLYTNNS